METDDIHFEVLDHEKQISLGPKLEQKTKVFMATEPMLLIPIN